MVYLVKEIRYNQLTNSEHQSYNYTESLINFKLNQQDFCNRLVLDKCYNNIIRYIFAFDRGNYSLNIY